MPRKPRIRLLPGVTPTICPGASRIPTNVIAPYGRRAAKGFAEPLEIRTADGSVRVGDSTGPLELHTDDGSVRAFDVASRRVRASTKDGSVKLELGVVPDLVESRSDDGSVQVSVPRDEDSSHVVSAHTEDGSVTVRNTS